MARILVIEDEENLRFSIRQALKKAGHEVCEADSAGEGRRLLRSEVLDLVLTDVNLRSGNGLELVREVRAEGYEGGVVVMTAYGSVSSAVEAMKLGADDYVQKPLSLEELVLLIGRHLESRSAMRRLKLYERLEGTRREQEPEEMLGSSPAWREAVSMADRLASLPLPGAGERGQAGRGGLPTILLIGETGTGKGVLARHIHARATERAGNGPLVHVNCSALPASLVESELFGHEKGAFTDAKSAREGLFEMAGGGTVFLDEIGDMPLELQAKILTVVEEGVFRRVGGTRDRRVHARVIAATNQDLEGLVAAGTFRRDLLYRLNAFTIALPPLRERGRDAVLIAEELLARLCRSYRRACPTLTEAARGAMMAHTWPGNVRELMNAVQRAAMLCDGDEVGPVELGLKPGHAADPPANGRVGGRSGSWVSPEGELVFDFEHGPHKADEVERALIVQALERCGGNVSQAARLIGMQRSSLRYRIDRFGLEGLVREIARR